MNHSSNIDKEKLAQIFKEADLKKEIRNFITSSLYDYAEQHQILCTWTVSAEKQEDTPYFNPLLHKPITYYVVEINVQSEDTKKQMRKHYLLGEDWKQEQSILKEIVVFLLQSISE